MKMLVKAANYAVVGSLQGANILVPLADAAIIYGVLWFLELAIAVPEDMAGGLLLLLATLGTSWVAVVTVRFLYWPWRAPPKRKEPVGAKIGDRGEWHIYADRRPAKMTSGPATWVGYFMQITTSQANPKTRLLEDSVIANAMIINFKVPVAATTVQVSSPDTALPISQVKFFGPTLAIISFDGKVPAGTLWVELV